MISIKLLPLAVGLLPSVLGFIGMGIPMYDPVCAYACRSVIATANIECDESHDHDDMDMSGMSGMSMIKRHGHDTDITPECRAMSEPFLTTLAYCINSTCSTDIKAWVLEKYWLVESTGEKTVEPMWTYEQSLMMVNSTPATTFDPEEMMMETQLLAPTDLEEQSRTLKNFADGEVLHARYTLILFILGIGIPVLTTFLTCLPFFNRLFSTVKPYALYPALFGGRNVQAFWRWCHFPTTGQSIYIFIFSALTLILSAVGYESVQPNTWYATRHDEILSKVAARTGVVAMGLAPLVLLFAGRNSVLLWMTNWSHSTYILLHRWVARLFGIQVILHSIFELVGYVNSGSYKENLVQAYWIWGCVGTVACSIMLVISVFRNSSYEIFLLIHIILAVFTLAGTWYHLDYRFQDDWGYKNWLYACFAIWAFDRILRVGRVLKNGRRTASFRPVGEEILRVDIEGIKWAAKAGQHAYIYFPILRKFTPWENHPFSVIPTNYLRPVRSITGSDTTAGTSRGTTPAETPMNEKELEGLTPTSSASTDYSPTSGITFFIKKNNGLTKHLWSNKIVTTSLVEGPYNGSSSHPVLLCDRLILIAGGIGITAVLPFAHAHPNVKIFWSMRETQAAMVKELQPGLRHIEQDIVTGKRLNLAGLLEKEVGGGWKDVGVVVCGPGGMCDTVRQEVVRVSKESKVRIELDVEAFSW